MNRLSKSAACALVFVACVVTAAPRARADEREPRQRTYTVGAGISGTRFRLEDGTGMGAMGPQITAGYTIGRRWGFAAMGAFMFPVHGRQNIEGSGPGQGPEGFALPEMYGSQRLSFDVSMMVYRRLHLTPNFDFVGGFGIDVHILRLISSVYNPIELISGGLSGLARIERRIDDHFFFGGDLAVSFDPIDFVNHRNRAVLVAPMALSCFIGVRR